MAGLDQRLQSRAVEVDAHHTHAFTVAPIEFGVILIEDDLFGGKGVSLGHDCLAILAVDIGALDGTVI